VNVLIRIALLITDESWRTFITAPSATPPGNPSTTFCLAKPSHYMNTGRLRTNINSSYNHATRITPSPGKHCGIYYPHFYAPHWLKWEAHIATDHVAMSLAGWSHSSVVAKRCVVGSTLIGNSTAKYNGTFFNHLGWPLI